ncbi:MAG: 4Fe-4S dicluster domain-containing protein [Chloroflexi bacterium]|nr:4Fe-4S dicluster domain-containing protein [Chloroflexota bacterium]
MKIGVMISDIMRSLFRRPVTEKYPFERRAAPQRLRGHLIWNQEKCSGCGMCSKDCPAQAIELITLDKANKRFVLRYHIDRCAFCAQCVQSCRFKCLQMSNNDWELAALKKEPFTISYGREEDIAALVGKLIPADAVTPEKA